MIEATATISKEDYKQSLRLHWRYKYRTFYVLPIIGLILISCYLTLSVTDGASF